MNSKKTLTLRSFLILLSLSACAQASYLKPDNITLPPTTPLSSMSDPIQIPTNTAGSVIPTPQKSTLTKAQAEKLRKVALAYTAVDEKSAIQVAKSMNYLGVNGFPSTMCGPLSIAILCDAGLLHRGVDLGDYFLLDPRPEKDSNLVDATFPPDKYTKYELLEPINSIDYNQFPLMAGDFIYLFAGKHGNYDHMITVDYVDNAGRAYAVTNLNTSKGYVIREVMLYDPQHPGEGQFFEWTDNDNRELGLTGFGGMWIWRLSKPPNELSSASKSLEEKIYSIQMAAGGKWFIYVQELGADPLFSERSDFIIHPASTIKIADSILFFKALEKIGTEDFSTFLDAYGTDGRSFRQLLHAMLVESEEAATLSLENWTDEIINANQTLHDLGFPKTCISPRQSTAHEMVKMLIGLYEGKLVSPEATRLILDYLAEITINDNIMLGVIRPEMSAGDVLYDKRGEIASGLVVVGDLGLLLHRGHAYAIAIYAFRNEKESSGTYESLQEGVEDISRSIWQIVKNE